MQSGWKTVLVASVALAGCVRAAWFVGPAADHPPAGPQDAQPGEGAWRDGSSADQAQRCLIDGVPYAPDTLKAGDSCRRCDPSFSQVTWAPARGCVITLAGNGTAGFVNGAGADARFQDPRGIAVDRTGGVYVADGNNHCIRLIRDGQVSTFAGTGSAGRSDGPLASAAFNIPGGLVFASDGTLWIADWANHLIRRIRDGQVSTFAGTGTGGTADGALLSAEFNLPHSLALGKRGELYVADCGGAGVRMIENGQVTSFAGTGVVGFQDGAAAIAQFDGPAGIVVNTAGDVLIGEAGNRVIRRIAGGQVSVFAGQATNAGYRDGPSAQALFGYPLLIAIDSADRVIVPDADNSRIRMVAVDRVSTVAGNGTAALVDGPVATASFQGPQAVAIDSAGRIYVADGGNHAVRVILP